MSPFGRMLLYLDVIKAETDTLNIEPDFSFCKGLRPTLTKPEYWNCLGSSKRRTKEQEDESRTLIYSILETCTPDTMIAFTDGSCHPNPGPCGAGASVNWKQPVGLEHLLTGSSQ